MVFEYIWGLLVTHKTPPTSDMFAMLRGQYKFFPFEHDGQVLTFDENIWNDDQDKTSYNILWPSNEQIENIIGDNEGVFKFIIALSNDEYAPTIERGSDVKIYKMLPPLREQFFKNYCEYGYDVVDVSGISALTDIGYRAEDTCLLEGIKVNKYGLISQSNNAIKVAKIASRLASEHAPFFPVNLWGNICR